jgi:nucleotide-binding universal stress UspA family protein
MIRKILTAYDGSKNGRRALDLAAELSAKLDASLMIAHVLMHGRPPEELVRMAEVENLIIQMQESPTPGLTFVGGPTYDLFKATKDYGGAQRVIPAVGDQLIKYAKTRSDALGAKDIQTTIHTGDYADEILKAADEYKADMIVLGSRGLGTIRGAVLGSVSQKVLHYADQTVVAVK